MVRPSSSVEPRFFATAAEFRAWLQANAATATELLVGCHKVDSGRPSMSWSESVDEALCVGWIDGVRRRIDDAAYSIRFTPRKAGSIWSAVNIAKVAQLRAQGRMRPAGDAAFSRRSEARSQVYAYGRPAEASLSAEEQAALVANAEALRYFDATPPSYRRVVQHWITSAKKAHTRAKRFATLLAACAGGQRLR